MDSGVLWRSALIQVASVSLLSLALAAALPHSFFEDWGWLAGPGAWLVCAALTARLLDLPLERVMLAALLAGIPSVLAVVAGVHWLGVVLAVAFFAVLCAHAATRGDEELALR